MDIIDEEPFGKWGQVFILSLSLCGFSLIYLSEPSFALLPGRQSDIPYSWSPNLESSAWGTTNPRKQWTWIGKYYTHNFYNLKWYLAFSLIINKTNTFNLWSMNI